MNERDKLIQQLIEEKGGTKQQYLQLLNSIAYHESAHTMDPTIRQIGGGPGRGKYQFEEGKNQGGITAARRTKQYYQDIGKKVPAWLEEATKSESLDASRLSSEQQDILFLGNMRKHPKADFSKVWKGDQSVEDFWANYHWAGLGKDREERLESFRTSMKELDKKKSDSSIYKSEERPEIVKDNIPTPTNYGSSIKDIVNYININKRNQEYSPDIEVNSINNISPYESLKDVISTLRMDTSVQQRKTGGNLNSYNVGGLHETNPYGGIPQGVGDNGKINTVEEGETSFNLPSGKFIFSDRINTNGKNNSVSKRNSYQEGGMIDPPTKDIEASRQFITNWFNNDITRERLSENLRSYPKAQSLINRGLRNIAQTSVEQNPPLDEIEGAYDNGKISLYGDVTPETVGHEFTHSLGSIDKELSDYIINKYGTPLGSLRQNVGIDDSTPLSQGVSKQFSIDPSTIFGRDQIQQEIKHGQYLGRNGELYPRFMEMRQFLNVQPGDIIDDSHLEKLQNDDRMKKMFNYYSPEQIKEILNTIATNNSIDQFKGLV